MAQAKRTSTKRFGVRYGRTLRDKLAPLEKASRKVYKCPYCSKNAAKRVSVGIWQCSKCNAKFASKAYNIQYSKQTRESLMEISSEKPSEELPEEIVAITQEKEPEEKTEEGA